MARTMSDEQERQIFAACDNDWLYTEQTYRKWCQSLKSELDAERAAHEETKGERDANVAVCVALQRQIATLKARLALAEAACEALDHYRESEGGAYSFDLTFKAHDAWREAQGRDAK